MLAKKPIPIAVVALSLVLLAGTAHADQPEIRVSRTSTMAYLPLMVVQQEKLLEKYAADEQIPNLKVSWLTFTGPSAQIEALLSGNVDIVATGSTGLITLWAKTKGSSLEVKGISALSSMPMALNTRDPQVKTIRDLKDNDRIAVPSVKVSFNATLLEMAAAKEWGIENYAKLDYLTVGLGQMDAVAAMLSSQSEINNDFCTPPFIYVEQENKAIRPVITLREILGENGTIATSSTTTKFYNTQPKLMKAYEAAVQEAMAIITKDKDRAVDDYVGATGDKKTPRDMLMKIINDPDAEFTTTPRSMMAYSEFMFKTGVIKKKPDTWSDLFFAAPAGGS